ncbi:class I SAM-dependent methyltransferase [Luteolibacter ambystomatis]|uniref:Class I SAM-dependent methyltransferase n=1 Tax=Luteolibacter ambystomatis TaxID=2824561 RepID=A0A975IXZ3_9BACT|nr:class I SAM-dependent methyltransferase [Luteolibacter ambystomatis]QUE49846.1 class I SAM-dependent methyltransferase [Luteolibacter ambystomatis]
MAAQIRAVASYQSLEAEFHDPFWEAEGPSVELPLLQTFLAHFPGPSLEVGCGSGRLLIPLLLEGFEVEGLEPSADMMALCRKKTAVIGLEPVLHAGTVEDFKSDTLYSAIVVPAFTLQLCPDPALALQCIAGLLKPEGGLYLTVFTPDAELEGDLPENEWYPDHEVRLPDGRIGGLETRHRMDPANRTLQREHRYTLMDAERNPLATHECSQTLRWFEPDELHALLVAAGFEHFEGIAEFEETCAFPEEADAQILTVIARRS